MKHILSLVVALFGIALTSVTSAHAAEVLKTGTFAGVGKHSSSGQVEIVKDGDVLKVVLKDDFTLLDAPTPRLEVVPVACAKIPLR